MKNLFLKVFFSILVVFLFYSISTKAYAQTPAANPYIVPNTASDVKPGLHTYIPAVFNEMMSATVCFLAGIDPITKTNNCLGITPDGKLGYAKSQGLNQLMASGISTLYQSGFPIGTGQYIAYLKDNFGLVKHAYAAPPDQSNISGFAGLSPLITIWSVIRNLAYLFIIIAFIFVGLAIMLRVKIDPRTVMTIENQLPKLVVGLLFVTFSFAIAGLMVDGMKILDGLMFNVYQSIPDDTTNNIHFNKGLNWTNDIQNSNPWDAVSVVVPANAKLLPVGTENIKWGFIDINIPIPLPSEIQDALGHIPFGIGDLLKNLFGVLKSATNNTPAEVSSQNSFGKGAENLAAAAAFSFGDVLNKFFKLNTQGATPPQFSFVDPTAPLRFVVNNFANGTPAGTIVDLVSAFVGGSWSWKLAQILSNAMVGAGGELATFGGSFEIPVGTIVAIGAFPFVWGGLFQAIDSVLRNAAAPIIVWFIVYIAVFLATARLFFSLVFAWGQILFQVVIGPFLIVFGMIPGVKGVGFVPWLKTLTANLMAFPITIGILLLGSALVQAVTGNNNFFIPPLVGGNALPVGLLMALNVIFAASSGPQIAKDMFGEKENKNFGAFGQQAGAGLQATTSAGKAAIYGFGKTPTPGQSGGALTALGQIWR